MQLPIRKQIRLDNYDYSINGAYFITICTYKHKHIFGEITQNNEKPIVGAVVGRQCNMKLSKCGEIVKKAINQMPNHYRNIVIDKYIIMPNHVHLIIVLSNIGEDGMMVGGRPMTAPTLSSMINQTKGYVTKQIGYPVWQKSFHDHIIRNEKEYEKIWEYIDQNPQTWQNDKYYT